MSAQEDAIVREEAERVARERAAAQAAQSRQVSQVAVASATTPAPSKPAAPAQAAQPAQQTSNAGQWMTFQATGYSTQQPGLSTHTRMGIDLRINPRVIAVDPRVIPLGTMVEVQGLGVYIAGDTGSAIKGNIIDIHYPTVGEALNWGRRNVKIRILN